MLNGFLASSSLELSAAEQSARDDNSCGSIGAVVVRIEEKNWIQNNMTS